MEVNTVEVIGRCHSKVLNDWANATLRVNLEKKWGAFTLYSITHEKQTECYLNSIVTPDNSPTLFPLMPRMIEALQSDLKMNDATTKATNHCSSKTTDNLTNATIKMSLIKKNREIIKAIITLQSMASEGKAKNALSFYVTLYSLPATLNLMPQFVKALESDSKQG